ncbi:MAG TPA: Gfo/Idh/MocA family oxidoreductase [Planctomycetota bacterium]
MAVTPVRLGYVGCGFVAQRIHLPNFVSLPECKLLAIAEVRKDLGESVAQRFGVKKLYRSHEELAADPEIEAVGVSGPYALQGKIAQDLLRAGKHVFMEKPMAVSVAHGEKIVAAAKSSKARLMVGYMKRYDAGNVLLKKHLDEWRSSNEMGRLLLARNHGFGGNWVYGQDPNVPFEKSPETAPPSPDECPAWLPEDRRGTYLSYLQQWTHNVNLLRYLLGDLDGSARVVTVQIDQDGLTGLVVFDIGGVRAVVESGYTKFHAWEEHTQIYFEGGWLRTEAPPLMLKEKSASVELYRAGKDSQPPQLIQQFAPPSWSYREEAKHFIECVRSGAPFRSSGEDTLHDVRIFETIYKQFLGK